MYLGIDIGGTRMKAGMVDETGRMLRNAETTSPATLDAMKGALVSLIRQVLYGNTYFRREFGKASAEYMLPDCFGFPASLPTILAHSGVLGFSTQKLGSAWQPAPQVGVSRLHHF